MSSKRKASEQPSGLAADIKKPRVANNNKPSNLAPIDPRKTATRGVKDLDCLRMLVHDTVKNVNKELHFKAIIYDEIDWNKKEHIDRINAWRNQIYGRAGIKNKSVLLWDKQEVAYIELYWQLFVNETSKRPVQQPRPKTVREDFNAFFKGKVFYSAGGDQHKPRVNREAGPFTSKMMRIDKAIKTYFQGKMAGKRGEAFYPKINQAMLLEYMKLKEDLAKLGCEDPMIIPWAEVEDEDNDNGYVLRCRQYLADLPDQANVELDAPVEDEDATLVGDENLNKDLLELATEPEKSTAEPMDIDEEPAGAGPSREVSPKVIVRKRSAEDEGKHLSHKSRLQLTNINPEVDTPRKKMHKESAVPTTVPAVEVEGPITAPATEDPVTPARIAANKGSTSPTTTASDEDSERTLVGEEVFGKKKVLGEKKQALALNSFSLNDINKAVNKAAATNKKFAEDRALKLVATKAKKALGKVLSSPGKKGQFYEPGWNKENIDPNASPFDDSENKKFDPKTHPGMSSPIKSSNVEAAQAAEVLMSFSGNMV